MGRNYIGIDVFNAALERMVNIYGEGHRVIVSFSAGKDSGVALELAILAARETNRLPVEVVMRDEEIMLPGTYEYAERCARRPEVDFHWVYARQPIINAFNRENPYWWVFDPELQPDEWVRQPPVGLPRPAYEIPELDITNLITSRKFPPAEGRDLMVVMGLRASESRGRMFGLHSSGSYVTKVQAGGYRKVRPLYDWGDGDVWKAIKDWEWDYNAAYDVMHRFGMSRRELRIAPPTMRAASIEILSIASHAWPQWFDRVATRCPGTRTAAKFGRRACEPIRRHGETWEECYQRTCIDDAPEWIAKRAREARVIAQRRHASHSSEPISQAALCPRCPAMSSWEQMCKGLYMGDPFCFFAKDLPVIEPEEFRPGSGRWGGKPTW